MAVFLHFGLLGLGVGALYVLAAQGLVVIYRGSGVLNFAQGAIGIAGAYIEYKVQYSLTQSYAVSVIAGVAFAAFLGVMIHNLVMRPLKRASSLTRLVATLGLYLLLVAVGTLLVADGTLGAGQDYAFIGSTLPIHVWSLGSGITITSDRVYLMAIALLGTAALWAGFRYTPYGRGTSAVAENQRAAASLGLSPDSVATVNWALGCALAAGAAILLVPITTLSVSEMSLLLLPTLAAALVGGFTSFPLTLLAGLGIGVASTELNYYASANLANAVPFMVIVAILVVRGTALPLRDFFLERLPTVGTGRVRPTFVAGGIAVAIVLIASLSVVWVDSIAQTMAVATILLSVVVLTGYAGQMSLAQFAIAGFGAFVAGRLASTQGVPFWAALLLGIAATVPLGVAFALTAVRTRGANLAIVTLGLGAATEFLILDSNSFTGGVFGTVVPAPTLFGFSISPLTHPQRYAIFSVLAFVAVALAVANVRRGRTGRRLLAVRTNERAATALGISVPAAKLYAFGLSAAIAALGGVIIAYETSTIVYSTFTNFTSITFVALAVIGGVGYIMGSFLGATLAVGSIGAQIGNALFGSDSFTQYLPVISAAIVILLILQNQNGIAPEIQGQLSWIARHLPRLPRGERRSRRATPVMRVAEDQRERAQPRSLDVRGVTVRYGAVVAVEDASLTVSPGTIVGLIGPNGAGKTSLIDAVTGYAPASGSITLGGADITGWSAVRRARSGISRSFQSLELFEDMTVLDNLRAACDERDSWSYVRDLVYPKNPPLPAVVVAAIDEFGLEANLGKRASELSHGERRLLAIARSISLEPSVLLLDEPAAGLTNTETAELGELVRRLATEWGLAILLVEHDVDFVMDVCDHIVVLDFGRKISEGAPDVVASDPVVIAAYIGEPLRSDDPTDPTTEPTDETRGDRAREGAPR